MANMKYNRRPPKERQNWHFNMSKKGATTNRGRKLSDFERGVHFGTAEAILNTRKKTAQYYHRVQRREYEQLFKGVGMPSNPQKRGSGRTKKNS